MTRVDVVHRRNQYTYCYNNHRNSLDIHPYHHLHRRIAGSRILNTHTIAGAKAPLPHALLGGLIVWVWMVG
jgi:hypothetical protein